MALLLAWRWSRSSHNRLKARRIDPHRSLKVEGAPGAVEVMRSGAAVWDSPARDDQILYAGDRLRALEKGRVTLRWSDNTAVRLPPFADWWNNATWLSYPHKNDKVECFRCKCFFKMTASIDTMWKQVMLSPSVSSNQMVFLSPPIRKILAF